MFFTFIKISKDSSAKYYQDNKETIQKKLAKDIKVFLKKKKKQHYLLMKNRLKLNIKIFFEVAILKL